MRVLGGLWVVCCGDEAKEGRREGGKRRCVGVFECLSLCVFEGETVSCFSIGDTTSAACCYQSYSHPHLHVFTFTLFPHIALHCVAHSSMLSMLPVLLIHQAHLSHAATSTSISSSCILHPRCNRIMHLLKSFLS